MAARVGEMRPLRVAMKEKTGLMCPPERGTVVIRKRKTTAKTTKGIKSFGSGSCEFKHEIIEAVRMNMSVAVATNSVSAALHT